jgi:hypothetical protein
MVGAHRTIYDHLAIKFMENVTFIIMHYCHKNDHNKFVRRFFWITNPELMFQSYNGTSINALPTFKIIFRRIDMVGTHYDHLAIKIMENVTKNFIIMHYCHKNDHNKFVRLFLDNQPRTYVSKL